MSTNPANVVDTSPNRDGDIEIVLYDAEGRIHRCPLTPARAAGLIRRLAGYLAAELELTKETPDATPAA